MEEDRTHLKELISLASCETGENGRRLRISRYFCSDYIALQLVKTFFATTAGYILILGLYAAGHAEQLLAEAVDMNIRLTAAGLAAGYVLLLAVTLAVTFAGAVLRYGEADRLKRRVKEILGRLSRI